jgi:hypothetical protein
MNHHEDEQRYLPRRALLRVIAILLLCLCIGGAVLHANLLHRFCCQKSGGGDGPDIITRWSVGWPVIYGRTFPDPLFVTLTYPPMEFHMIEFHWVLVDLFVAAVLVISPLGVFRLRPSGCVRSNQFTRSSLFSLATAIAVAITLFTLDRTYGWAQPVSPVMPGVYSALSLCPWYDQVLISIGLVCALRLAITASSQMVRAVAVQLRSPGNE